MNKLKSILLVAFLFGILLACSKDDDSTLYSTYTSEDLMLVHNDSSKTWNLVAYYNSYPNNLNSQNDCYIDETYIFKPEGIVEVISGSENCFYGDSEISTSNYDFYEETGQIFLNMAKREISGELVSNMVFSLPLMELEEDKMLFAAGEKGNYGRTLIFVRE